MFLFLASLAIAAFCTILLIEQYQRWSLRRRIRDLRTEAAQIGNAYQFVTLGEASRRAGDWIEAANAFETAVSKDPESLAARWGLALVRFQQKRFDDAETLLQTILLVDPRYKFGDVSLLLGKTLSCLGKHHQAVDHLTQHIRRWRTPDAMYLLALSQQQIGDAKQADATLNGLLVDLDRTPRSAFAQTWRWRHRARKLQRSLSP